MNSFFIVITLYGIRNCDTVKKARTWLTDHGIDHQFHDFKKHGIAAELAHAWCAAVGWQALINRAGTTWRKLSPEAQALVQDTAHAVSLMQSQPSVIKRPILMQDNRLLEVGFTAERYAHHFS